MASRPTAIALHGGRSEGLKQWGVVGLPRLSHWAVVCPTCLVASRHVTRIAKTKVERSQWRLNLQHLRLEATSATGILREPRRSHDGAGLGQHPEGEDAACGHKFPSRRRLWMGNLQGARDKLYKAGFVSNVRFVATHQVAFRKTVSCGK